MIKELLHKEIRLEFRQRETIVSALLYLLSTVYVCYLSFQELDSIATWNALFWIIILFTAFNAMSRTFRNERPGVQLYLYTIISPQALLLSKMIFNAVFMLILSLLAVVFMLLFLGGGVLRDVHVGGFVLAIALGSITLSAGLTLVSGIAVKTNHNIGLTAILGFPVLIPCLLVLREVTITAAEGGAWSATGGNLLLLAGITLLISGLGYILFPYLWRE